MDVLKPIIEALKSDSNIQIILGFLSYTFPILLVIPTIVGIFPKKSAYSILRTLFLASITIYILSVGLLICALLVRNGFFLLGFFCPVALLISYVYIAIARYVVAKSLYDSSQIGQSPQSGPATLPLSAAQPGPSAPTAPQPKPPAQPKPRKPRGK